jgi:hypothetical protein
VDSLLQHAETLKRVKKLAETLPNGSVISFSAAMPANLMIDALARSPFGQRQILIDFGSLWDPYAGVKNRSYMKGMDVDVTSWREAPSRVRIKGSGSGEHASTELTAAITVGRCIFTRPGAGPVVVLGARYHQPIC